MKKIRELLLLFVMLVASLVITACGGGGGNQSTSNSEESGSESISESLPEESESFSETVETKATVTVDVGNGLSFDGTTEAIVGEDYFFEIKLLEGYEKSDDFSVTVDGVDAEYDETSGKYVVRNVEYGFTVLASGAEEIRYNVTFTCEEFPDALAVTETTYKYTAENFTFSVMLTDFYTDCIDQIEVYYSVDGGEEILLERVDGQYTIANPKADIAIIVRNVAENKYDVSFAYNGEVKYTVEDVVSGNGVPEEELANAISAVVGDTGLTFVGWEEKMTAVKKDVTYNAVLVGGEIETVTDKLFASASEDEMVAPYGYESVYREVAVWDESKASPSTDFTVWGNVANVDIACYKEIYFQIRVDESWALLDGWSSYLTCDEGKGISNWMLVSIIKTGIYDWEVTTYMVGAEGEKKTTLAVTGSTLAEVFAIEMDTRTTADCTPTEIYATEVIGVIDPSYVNPIPTENTVKVAQSAFENGIDINGKQFVLDAEETAPSGYESVYKYENDSARDIHGQFYSGQNLDGYDIVYFAVKTAKINFNGEWKDGFTDWLYFALVKTEEDVWSITVAHGNKIIFAQEGLIGTYDSSLNPAYSDNALDAILYGKPSQGFYPYCSEGEVLAIYCTEVRGVLNPDFIVPEIVPEGTQKVADSAYVNGVDVGGGSVFALTDEITAPNGFSNVYKYESASEKNIHGKSFSDVNLDKYTSVYFALKTAKVNLNGEYKEGLTDWVYFVLTQTSEKTWSLVVIYNGEEIYKVDALNGAYATNENYTDNALDAILYGNPAGVYPYCSADETLTVYCTEVLGVVDPSYVDPNPVVGEKIADSAYENGVDVGGGAQFTATTEISAPTGFENVYKYQSTESMIHGKSFCGLDLTEYTTVTFALKTASFNFNQEATKELDGWMIFTLTQTGTNTWSLVVTCDGETIFEKTGLNGAYATNENYTNNALDAILYGNPSGFYPQAKDGNLTVYVTELRGIK